MRNKKFKPHKSGKGAVPNFDFKYKIQATAQIEMRFQSENRKSRHLKTELITECDKPLAMYNDDKTLNALGVTFERLALAQGIIANIHYSHKRGYIDSAKNLREIFKIIEDGFASVVEVSNGKFKDINE